MAKAMIATLVIVLLNLVLLFSTPAESEPITEPISGIECSKVVKYGIPCLDYVRDKENKPSQKCCDGIKELASYCKNQADRQAACECLKKKVEHMKIDVSRLLHLPKKCGMTNTFGYGVNINIDCKMVP
ncbi:non-specific lipid-transfer protein 3-like [Mercurialis annua]|uniref:non-specific lipid-transfer protein 3-like n=1 Tax=Mercurialis annua TaxID=3986 RepID=UPI0021603C18|nr:non-specific lipid-transfer protein 3-like [Mercurialis annua]